jgi:hypothetical protein
MLRTLVAHGFHMSSCLNDNLFFLEFILYSWFRATCHFSFQSPTAFETLRPLLQKWDSCVILSVQYTFSSLNYFWSLISSKLTFHWIHDALLRFRRLLAHGTHTPDFMCNKYFLSWIIFGPLIWLHGFLFRSLLPMKRETVVVKWVQHANLSER